MLVRVLIQCPQRVSQKLISVLNLPTTTIKTSLLVYLLILLCCSLATIYSYYYYYFFILSLSPSPCSVKKSEIASSKQQWLFLIDHKRVKRSRIQKIFSAQIVIQSMIDELEKKVFFQKLCLKKIYIKKPLCARKLMMMPIMGGFRLDSIRFRRTGPQ